MAVIAKKNSSRKTKFVAAILLSISLVCLVWWYAATDNPSFVMPLDQNPRNNYVANSFVWITDNKPYVSNHPNGVFTLGRNNQLKKISDSIMAASSNEKYAMSLAYGELKISLADTKRTVFKANHATNAFLDGQYVYYIPTTNTNTLFRSSIVSHEEQAVASSVLAYCPFGDNLLYLNEVGELMALDMSNMKTKHIADFPSEKYLCFFMDGSTAYFQSNNNIWAFDFADQELKLLLSDTTLHLENLFNGKLYLSEYTGAGEEKRFSMERYILSSGTWEESNYLEVTLKNSSAPSVSIVTEQSVVLQTGSHCLVYTGENAFLMY